MNKLKFFTALCCAALLLASCEEEKTDARDAIVGRYTYTQTGSVTISDTISQPQTISLDDKGAFVFSKNTSTTTCMYVDGRDVAITSAWVAGTNTLCLGDATGTYIVDGVSYEYTIAFSPCQVYNKNFTVIGTISCSESGGKKGSGTISITANSKK